MCPELFLVSHLPCHTLCRCIRSPRRWLWPPSRPYQYCRRATLLFVLQLLPMGLCRGRHNVRKAHWARRYVGPSLSPFSLSLMIPSQLSCKSTKILRQNRSNLTDSRSIWNHSCVCPHILQLRTSPSCLRIICTPPPLPLPRPQRSHATFQVLRADITHSYAAAPGAIAPRTRTRCLSTGAASKLGLGCSSAPVGMMALRNTAT